MMRRLAAILALICATVLTACSSTTSAAPAAGGGEGADGPKKVVVLDYNALDTLDALGLGDRVVAVPVKTLPGHLQSYKDKTDVGTLKEPDMEAIAQLAPDLIVYGPRTVEKKDELGKIAKTIDSSIEAKDFMGSFKKTTTELADLFGKKAEAEQKIKALDEQIATAKKGNASKGKALVILVSGGKLSAFGPASRFGIIHQDLGITPAVENLSDDRHGQAVSFEFIAKANPDVIYVIDRDAAIGEQGKSAQQVLDNDLVNKTSAAQKGRITYLDGARWYLLGGGLANLSEMVKAVQEPLA